MSRGRHPDMEKRERVQRLLDQGMTQAEIGRKTGVRANAVYKMIKKMRGETSVDNDFPAPFSTIDNAIKEAFRKVIGYCPIRDRFPRSHDGF